jgi:hypothetical protein
VPRLRMHGAIPPLPQYVFFMAWCLVKHRDFTYHLCRYVYDLSPYGSKFHTLNSNGSLVIATKSKATYSLHAVTILLLHILKKGKRKPNRSVTPFEDYHHTSLQGPT